MRNVADVFPLTPTQAGMLYHTLAAPGSGVYVVQVVHELAGEVDLDRLARSWQLVVDRRPALRTAFVWEGMDKPLAVVREHAELEVTVHDRPTELEGFLADDRARGFDTTVAPVQRVALLRSGRGSSTMVWSFHHALVDGWSTRLVIADVLVAYGALAGGADPDLPERRPFRDYIAWLDRQDAPAAERFWRSELAGFTTPTALPRRSATPGTDHRTIRHVVPAGDSAALREAARAARVTASTVIRGAWALLLSRYSGHDDVVFGATTSGRPATLEGAEHMIGMFLTTIPARVQVDPGAALPDWLRRVQARDVAAREHEFAPLVDIQRWSELPPGTQLFDTIVVFESFPRDDDPPDAGIAVGEGAFHDHSNYPVAVIVGPGERMEIKLIHDRAIVDDATADGLLDHLASLLGAIAERPDARLADLEMLTAPELERLGEWGGSSAAPAGPLVPDLISGHAASSPAAVAVACGGEQLTYGELGERSAALAAELRRAGAGPGCFVGIHLERSVDLMVAMVGVLRAGAAYVPLDPSYPAERVAFMLDDAGAPFVVTTSDGSEAGDALPGIDAVLVATGSAVPPVDDRPAGPDDPAYMIYTSGSTGRPNGVPITHRNLAVSTLARFDHYDAPPGAFLLLSSFSFDSSVVGIHWTLCGGGTLVLPMPGEELDLQALARAIRDRGVTHTLCLPSLYRLLLDHVPDALGSLEVVMVAGEACPADLVDLHRRVLPDCALYNEYGPTEGTVWCTVHRCDTDPGPGPVPIGRPVPGYRVALLDRHRRPVPAGVPGELWVGGPGVASGYHLRPELTASRFADFDGEHWFRTGDVARYRADGAIEFLGRADDQVKIRGFRVELGEVEAALARHDGIAAAAVAAIADQAGSRLAAYVEAAGEQVVDVEALQGWLRERVPDHMVPGAVVTVEALPRLPNGKVDRAALPSLDPGSGRAAAPPRDEVERRILDIWQELLPGADIGVHDDFFQVGGHSLLAVSLVERIRKATGKQLRLATLLEAPTVAGQARLARGERPPGRGSVVAVKPEGDRPPLFLVPPVAGTPLAFHELAKNLAADQPLYAFAPVGSDGRAEPHRSVRDMAARYVADMRELQPAGPYRIGGSCMGAHVAWEMARQLTEQGEAVESIVALDARPPDNGPGWSARDAESSLPHLVRASIRHLLRGTLLETARLWRRLRRDRRRLDEMFGRMRQAHLAAQRTYEAAPLDVSLYLVQSTVTAELPVVRQRWGTLARRGVEAVVVENSTHEGLLTRDPDQIREMGELVEQHLTKLGSPAAR